jgi:hypothetical protein
LHFLPLVAQLLSETLEVHFKGLMHQHDAMQRSLMRPSRMFRNYLQEIDVAPVAMARLVFKKLPQLIDDEQKPRTVRPSERVLKLSNKLKKM